MIIGVGVDLVEHERVKNVMMRHEGRFARKVFTDEERAYCEARAMPHVHYAARFAAKEAFLKAVGLGMSNGMRWRDCGIINNPFGQPDLAIVGNGLKRCQEMGVTHSFVSLSHSRGHAIAMVILEKRDHPDEDAGLGKALSKFEEL